MLASWLAALWRAAVLLCDYWGWYRWLSGQAPIDVAIITNIRDEAEGYVFWGDKPPKSGHCNGARIYLHGVAGQVRGLNVTAEQLLSKQGRQQAKQLFIDAVYWARKRGAKVVLLAASTKRLFGRDGAELKRLFPDLLFTIGDNGTATLLCRDVDRALAQSDLPPDRARILVLGASGILGSAVREHLLQQHYDVVGLIGQGKADLPPIHESALTTVADFASAGKVDAVIACTHNLQARLTAAAIETLRKPGRKLLVVDVAEPANLEPETYRASRSRLVRQDAGNAFSPHLHYVLGGISSRLLNLAPQVVFGCFAESLALYYAVYCDHNHALLNQDWFQVNALNRAMIENAFESVAVDCPQPCCFNEAVESFLLPLADTDSPEASVAADWPAAVSVLKCRP